MTTDPYKEGGRLGEFQYLWRALPFNSGRVAAYKTL